MEFYTLAIIENEFYNYFYTIAPVLSYFGYIANLWVV